MTARARTSKEPLLLVADVGNTKIALGVFEKEKLLATWRIATDVNRLADEYSITILSLLENRGIPPTRIKAAILCSVVPPLAPIFQEVCRRYFSVTPLEVGPGIKTGVRVATDNPKEVGADRVVNAVAVHNLYGGPAIVIDLGTATTVDAISKDGDYLGGAIAPGMGIAAEALYEHTAKLPRVELVRPKQAIGKNTVASIQAGMFFGYVGLIEGLVARVREELGGKVKVIATGGLADLLAKETKVIDIVDHDLTLIGLRIIYEVNKE